MFSVRRYNNTDLRSFTETRKGETRLGEKVNTEITPATRFVILGIAEDIGPRANHGRPGSTNAFDAFLSRFLNVQSNQFLSGQEIAVFGKITANNPSEAVEDLRKSVDDLDQLVFNTIQGMNLSQQKLIVVGGGHNNAYPVIKSISKRFNKALSIINIDPHADCRPPEGRHSGNAFSTAISEQLILSYNVLGLHEQYNSQQSIDFLKRNHCFYSFYEDYIDYPDLQRDIENFKTRAGSQPVGIEIDLDCIEHMPTSAYTPCGFSISEVREALRKLATTNAQYLHLPEGAPTNNAEEMIVGKTLSYLVCDFIKKSSF